MSTQLNVVYGILTNGDNTQRKTTVEASANRGRIVQALIPSGASAACQRALAEIYLRLCMTDKQLYAKLLKVDPVNSYKLQPFYEEFNDSGVLANIVSAVKQLGLADEERSALAFDLIKNALDKLLDTLNG